MIEFRREPAGSPAARAPGGRWSRRWTSSTTCGSMPTPAHHRGARAARRRVRGRLGGRPGGRGRRREAATTTTGEIKRMYVVPASARTRARAGAAGRARGRGARPRLRARSPGRRGVPAARAGAVRSAGYRDIGDYNENSYAGMTFVLTLGAAVAVAVELLESLAIVLAVGATRRWSDALIGAAARSSHAGAGAAARAGAAGAAVGGHAASGDRDVVVAVRPRVAAQGTLRLAGRRRSSSVAEYEEPRSWSTRRSHRRARTGRRGWWRSRACSSRAWKSC